MNETTDKNARKNRLTLLVLFLVFLTPALGSWLLYTFRAQVHLGTTNKGEFVNPPRAIDVTGLGLPSDYFAHHQTLIYVSGPDCGTDCRHALTVMQATQLSLGEQTSEVQRMYLALGKPAADVTDKGLMALDASAKPALAAFDGAEAPGYIYLADQNGYVVLRYKLSEDPKHILIDLRHLLGSGG
jgi:hypothetical protein